MTPCFILIEAITTGCLLKTTYVGITLSQNDAYLWQQSAPDVYTKRQAIQSQILP